MTQIKSNTFKRIFNKMYSTNLDFQQDTINNILYFKDLDNKQWIINQKTGIMKENKKVSFKELINTIEKIYKYYNKNLKW